MILVAVGQDDRADRLLDEVRDVGQDEIDAEVLVPREREARVDHDPVVAVLEDGHVLADLAEPAERNDAGADCHRHGVYGRPSAVRRATAASSPRRWRQSRICGGLVLVGLDEREPQAADLVAEELEGALDRDRVRLHAEQLDRGPQLLVERACTVEVARRVSA